MSAAMPRAYTREYIQNLPDEALVPTAVLQALLPVSRSTTYRLEQSGKLKAVRLGSRRLYPMGRVRQLLRDLAADATAEALS